MDATLSTLVSSGHLPGGESSAELLWLYALSDTLIIISCYSIPISFAYFVWRRKDLEHRWIFIVFGVFILAYGMSHLLSLILLWHPVYWLDVSMKLLTAAISVGTAIMVKKIIPYALKIPNPTQLAAEVAMEIQERREAFVALKTTELSLRESQELLRTANLELEGRVESRTQELARQSSVLRGIIDSIPDLIVLKDTDSKYLGLSLIHISEPTRRT